MPLSDLSVSSCSAPMVWHTSVFCRTRLAGGGRPVPLAERALLRDPRPHLRRQIHAQEARHLAPPGRPLAQRRARVDDTSRDPPRNVTAPRRRGRRRSTVVGVKGDGKGGRLYGGGRLPVPVPLAQRTPASQLTDP
eukprot:5275263-Pyramimonas_sp.AAC.1